jgi:hypothetical protein
VKIEVRRLGKRGFEWVRAPGVKVSNGLPRVRREPPTPAQVAAQREMQRQLQQAYSPQQAYSQISSPFGRSVWP